MAQLNVTLSVRVPLRVSLIMRLLTLWVWLGSFFPEGLVSIEIDAKVLSDRMQYRAGKSRWRRIGD